MERRRFADLHHTWGPVIHSRCARLLGEGAAAEEAAREVFVRVHRRLDTSHADDALRWIYWISASYVFVEKAAGGPSVIADLADLEAITGGERAREAAEGEHANAMDLDRAAFGIGPREASRAALGPHLAVCSACRAERDLRDRHATAFRAGARAALSAVRRRASSQAPIVTWARRRLPWLSLAVAGVVAIGAGRSLLRPTHETFGAQPKGDFDIVVFARHEDRIEALDRYNRWVSPGEEVRFVLTGTPDDHPQVIVASVDAKARVSIYYPYEGTTSATLPGPGRWEVPGSIQLDETLGPERVFVFFAKAPLAAADVERALLALGTQGPNAIRDARTVDLSDTVQRSFLMMKRTKP